MVSIKPIEKFKVNLNEWLVDAKIGHAYMHK